MSHFTIAIREFQIVIPKKAILNIVNYSSFERRTVSSQCNGFFMFLTLIVIIH